MKIAIASVQVPFIKGGAEVHAHNLCKELIIRGYEADVVTIPFKWYPASSIVDGMLAAKLLDLSEVNGNKIDKVIALKFPAYLLEHENKVVWLLHQHRQAYELWGTPYGDLENMEDGIRVREMIINSDTLALKGSSKVFANSKTVAQRLKAYNNVDSIPLYHPPSNYEKFYCDQFDNYIFYPGRIDEIKRQHLLIEALSFTNTPIKILLAGSIENKYEKRINDLLTQHDLKDRVKFVGFVSEEEKRNLYANALAVYNGPYQEDYGYVTLEGFFSAKPVLTHSDSGGPLEFVQDEQNGFITEPSPSAIAKRLDELYNNKNLAREMGKNGRKLMDDLNINWDYVIKRLVE
ncbi:glycosyltransferase family 4 protein [Paenibacillus sp. USDA918EY]|uniref:glycosyltransferase family 4 protein n=1 Tax=Paenibacillus sp. USDA918EY TaxID=2689575 RepID=UPI00135AD483|nr:glycosyltransferase family 4 protein [Paenibacillus sp. USDA918EY]